MLCNHGKSTSVYYSPGGAACQGVGFSNDSGRKIDYISGPKSFYIRAVPRLGIPEIRMADGPQGIRNNTQSTLYPCGILSASTWNRKLARELGHGLARDAKARGVSILLGPGVNIYRSPLCGRNYEYFGEDPYLTGETAKEYILGVQEEGVMATVKHLQPITRSGAGIMPARMWMNARCRKFIFPRSEKLCRKQE